MMDYFERVKRVREELLSLKIEALLVTEPIDLFYLTGLECSSGKLLITPQQVHFLLDGRYIEQAKETSPFPVSLYNETLFWEQLQDQKNLAVEGLHTSHQAFSQLEKESEKRDISLVAVDHLIEKIRSIKDPEEIILLKEAAKLGSLGFDFLLTKLREGVLEDELAFELEFFWRKKGASGVSFKPIVAFGRHSSMPHYRAGKAALKPGDIVLLDIGVTLKHYHSDMTRVVFFKGADEELKKVHSIVLKAYNQALALCKPGVFVSDLDKAARSIIEEAGYGKHFTHSLGHGVGLDIHEWPLVKKMPLNEDIALEEGMVITIEPGIYLPNLGGVRLEDTIAITADSFENLTNRNLYFEV